MELLTQRLENTSYVTPVYTESWLRSFQMFLDKNADFFNISIKSEDDFIAVLKEVTEVRRAFSVRCGSFGHNKGGFFDFFSMC